MRVVKIGMMLLAVCSSTNAQTVSVGASRRSSPSLASHSTVRSGTEETLRTVDVEVQLQDGRVVMLRLERPSTAGVQFPCDQHQAEYYNDRSTSDDHFSAPPPQTTNKQFRRGCRNRAGFFTERKRTPPVSWSLV
jgi:hypothetical protein